MSAGGPTTDRNRVRKRAAIALGAVAAVAAVLVLLMVTLIHTPSRTAYTPPLVLDQPTRSSAKPSTPAPISSTPRPTPSQTASTTTCPTDSPCVLSGDPGRLVAAVNAFRSSHAVTPLTATMSTQAGACALGNGDGPACGDSYFWEPVGALDGGQVVTKVANQADGSSWLLDPALKLGIGWAKLGSGSFACALLDVR